eukprot:TRINITY_DN22801_c0_g1_i1.p1 TRINITY_DN22801_c0_g1~~TRINITY_DN22801_c0_g1_i1.p1  ORF type:complete len:1027 (+),score=168.26 TRINITY_DN22801_c0_g1_i1:49-3081(+)
MSFPKVEDDGGLLKTELNELDLNYDARKLEVKQEQVADLKRIDDKYPFKTFTAMLEKILTKSGAGERLSILEMFWKSLAASAKKLYGSDARVDHFPFMRLLLPHLDTHRQTYGLKESKIAQHYIHLLQLPADSFDAQRMLRWKDPNKSSAQVTHFSDVVYAILVKRGFTVSDEHITVSTVNEMLDNLSKADSPDKKKAVIMNILRTTSALEQKWILRILLKDMRLHIQHSPILGRFHPCAVELYNTTTDLREVCTKTSDPSFLPADHRGVSLFRPFAPMLASLVSKDKLDMLLSTEKMTVEPKYDGERHLLHFQRNIKKLMFWTRNAKDYSDVYGPKFLTQALESINCETCILDGELVVYSKKLQGYKPFGTNKTFALDNTSNPDENFCYLAFDVVFLNGEVLTELTYDQRRQKLLSIITEKPNVFELVKSKRVQNTKEVFQALDESVSNGFEGIVLKNAGSSYKAGERRLKWLKLKRDHIQGLADTMDLVVLGGYYGTKFGKNHISHFLLGVQGPDGIWYTFTKVGTGYTEVELSVLITRLEPHWQPYDKNNPPSHLGDWKAAADDLPDVFIDPDKSVVLEIFGYSFTDTVKFKVGKTVRFPRVHHIRSDKEVADAMTLEVLTKLIETSSQNRKLAADLADNYTLTKAKRAIKKKEQFHNIPQNFAATTTKVIPNELDGSSNTFIVKGVPLRFCVMQSDNIWRKDVLEDLITKHGGLVVANPTKTSHQLAATENNAKVKHWKIACEKNLSEEKYLNKYILHYNWVIESIKVGQPIPCAPRYMVYCSERMKQSFARTMDKYGDAFAVDATVDSMRQSIEEAQSELQDSRLSKKRLWDPECSISVRKLKVELGIENHQLPNNIFTNVVLQVVGEHEVPTTTTSDEPSIPVYTNPVMLSLLLASRSGATVIEPLTAKSAVTVANPGALKPSFLIVNARSANPLASLQSHLSPNSPPIVHYEWIDYCISENSLLPTTDYLLSAYSSPTATINPDSAVCCVNSDEDSEDTVIDS